MTLIILKYNNFFLTLFSGTFYSFFFKYKFGKVLASIGIFGGNYDTSKYFRRQHT